jgi:hypothetical protein
MLDPKGIRLSEVNKRYPRSFQPLGYDVLLDIDSMYKPKVISSFDLTVNSVITLLMMKPGQYPSIPELGLDIESYLFEYADDKTILQKLHAKLRDQMNRIDISGVDVQFQSDYTEDGTPVLLVIITGNKFVAYGSRSDKVIVGITYSKLNELYIRKVYDERSANT